MFKMSIIFCIFVKTIKISIMKLSKFHIFDPMSMNSVELPNEAGNYLFLLREGSKLPELEITPYIPEVELDGKNYQVTYTGIASCNIRQRDYCQHFVGNDASHSTLRKSLGCLFGYEFVPRKEGDTKHKKFCIEDEIKLSAWMTNNLLLAYIKNDNPKPLEDELIDGLNPPLNLSKNHNQVNADYRRLLSELRNRPIAVVNVHDHSGRKNNPIKRVLKTCLKHIAETFVKSSTKNEETTKRVPVGNEGNERIKHCSRTINFGRKTNNYRCKYSDRNSFDILEVRCQYKDIIKTFKIESKYLPDKDSIHFRAYLSASSFTVEWDKAIEAYMKEVR